MARLARDLAAEPVNVLVNNAGAVVSFAPLHELEPDEWMRILNINLTSVDLGMRFIIPLMVDAGGGAVINMSSIAGVVGTSVGTRLSGSEGRRSDPDQKRERSRMRRGVTGQSATWLISTPMVAEQPQWATDGIPRPDADAAPAGEPIDVAHAVVYLASREASFVTGAESHVDGGFLAQLPNRPAVRRAELPGWLELLCRRS